MATKGLVGWVAATVVIGACAAGAFVTMTAPPEWQGEDEFAEAWIERDAVTIPSLDEMLADDGGALQLVSNVTGSILGKPVETVATKPTMTLLRIENDGSGLIGGRAAPGTTLTIMKGDTALGRSAVDPVGDYVVLLEEPLEPGEHTLSVVASGPAGRVRSEDMAVVSIDPDTPGPVPATIMRDGVANELANIPVDLERPYTTGSLARAPQAPHPAMRKLDD